MAHIGEELRFRPARGFRFLTGSRRVGKRGFEPVDQRALFFAQAEHLECQLAHGLRISEDQTEIDADEHGKSQIEWKRFVQQRQQKKDRAIGHQIGRGQRGAGRRLSCGTGHARGDEHVEQYVVDAVVGHPEEQRDTRQRACRKEQCRPYAHAPVMPMFETCFVFQEAAQLAPQHHPCHDGNGHPYAQRYGRIPEREHRGQPDHHKRKHRGIDEKIARSRFEQTQLQRLAQGGAAVVDRGL